MLFTVNQLVAHMIGDYLLQSHDIAQRKILDFRIALYHAALYTIPFYFLTNPSPLGMILIVLSHALIDRYRVARALTMFKNYAFPFTLKSPWEKGTFIGLDENTGFPPTVPPHLAVWLYIITDNLLHIIVQAVILHYT